MLKNHDFQIMKNIVAAVLQEQEWIGSIYTKAKDIGAIDGSIEGLIV
jgi:hypothetical protein